MHSFKICHFQKTLVRARNRPSSPETIANEVNRREHAVLHRPTCSRIVGWLSRRPYPVYQGTAWYLRVFHIPAEFGPRADVWAAWRYLTLGTHKRRRPRTEASCPFEISSRKRPSLAAAS